MTMDASFKFSVAPMMDGKGPKKINQRQQRLGIGQKLML
jgi:hypothetical protein